MATRISAPMRLHLVVVALAVVAVSSCSDSTAPGPITGAYLLRTVAGQPLPVLVSEAHLTYPGTGVPGTRRIYLDGMRLAIPRGAPDTVAFVERVTWDLETGDDQSPSFMLASATNAIRGDTLCLTFGGPFGTGVGDGVSPCTNAPTLTRRGGDVVAQIELAPWPQVGRVEYVFGRE